MARLALFLGFPIIGAPILIFMIAGCRFSDTYTCTDRPASKLMESSLTIPFEHNLGETQDLERGLNIPIPIHVPRSSANPPADSRQDPKFTRLQEGRTAGGKDSGTPVRSLHGKRGHGQERSMIGTFPVRNFSE
jgi:hypothetical protein